MHSSVNTSEGRSVTRTALQVAKAPPLETVEQQSLFAWADLMKNRLPELEDLFAVPNGSYKSRAMAAKFQREGLKPGVPDVILPHARGGYYSLYIEMKRQRVAGDRVELKAGTRPSKEQLRWHERLRLAGMRVEVCYGWEDARGVIEQYLRMPAPNENGILQAFRKHIEREK